MTRQRGSKKPKCVLCGAALVDSSTDGFLLHTDVAGCEVVITDRLGVCVDDVYELIDGQVYERLVMAVTTPAPVDFSGVVYSDGVPVAGHDASAFLSADAGARRLFDSINRPYLGGSSGSRGWSSVSTFQKCPYLWQVKYRGAKSLYNPDVPGPEALEIGSLTHLFLAIHYSQRIDPTYPVDPYAARRFLSLAPVTPAYLEAAWQLFDGYLAYWGDEAWMTPLAVEELAVDPRSGFSCRWDLIFRVDAPFENMLPGIYVCNSKTAGDNSAVTRDQWKNDGQILGEIDLYQRLGYHRRFGPLRAACVNILIKTKVPQYTRSLVIPSKPILRDHHNSLRVWDAQMRLAEATGNYPRSRASCITRYRGFCELFDHCAGADGDLPREVDS